MTFFCGSWKASEDPATSYCTFRFPSTCQHAATTKESTTRHHQTTIALQSKMPRKAQGPTERKTDRHLRVEDVLGAKLDVVREARPEHESAKSSADASRCTQMHAVLTCAAPCLGAAGGFTGTASQRWARGLSRSGFGAPAFSRTLALERAFCKAPAECRGGPRGTATTLVFGGRLVVRSCFQRLRVVRDVPAALADETTPKKAAQGAQGSTLDVADRIPQARRRDNITLRHMETLPELELPAASCTTKPKEPKEPKEPRPRRPRGPRGPLPPLPPLPCGFLRSSRIRVPRGAAR